MQPPRPFQELPRVSLRKRARYWNLRGAVEKSFSVVGLDGGVALIAGEPVALGGIDPLGDGASAEVTATHLPESIEHTFVQVALSRALVAGRSQ
jgi:hypothetical protein